MRILDLTAKPFKFHSKISHPHAGSPWSFCLLHPCAHSLLHALSDLPASQQSPTFGVCSPRVLKKNRVFSRFLSFFGFFSLVREDPNLCCCVLLYASGTSDAGNRLPLCEGEVDFICQVPNLNCSQLLISLINS